MAASNWPNSNHNALAVTDIEYEQLAAPYIPSGVIGKPGDSSLVYADSTGRQIKVRLGKFALLRAQVFSSGSSDVIKSIASNSGATRYDLIVLQWNRATLVVDVVVKTGTPGSGPPSPTMSTGTTGVYEMSLAIVEVRTGVSTIAASDVTQIAYYVAPQKVVCTSATRPPHAPGLDIYETDTTNAYTSDGAHWINPNEDTAWLDTVGTATGWDLTLGRIRRVNGVVYLGIEAIRTGGPLAANTVTVIGTVPTGYRPSRYQHWVGWLDGDNAIRGHVETNGQITIVAYNPVKIVTADKQQVQAYGGSLDTGDNVVACIPPYPIGG